jgi:hypothetical protein
MELTKVMTLFSLSTCLFYSCSLVVRQARRGHNPNSAWAAGHPKLSYGDPTLPHLDVKETRNPWPLGTSVTPKKSINVTIAATSLSQEHGALLCNSPKPSF